MPRRRFRCCDPGDQPSSLSSDKRTSERFVTRGGDKLRGAIDALGIPVQGRVCLDVGSSHGGFTDCLLQAGAASVWCVDVGYGLLDFHLRKDPRVHLLERTNIRHLERSALLESPSLITIDVSFIALARILPKIGELSDAGTDILAMVKPQFEGTPKEAPRGVVRDEAIRQSILRRVEQDVAAAGFRLLAAVDARIKGPKGNLETFFHLKRR